MRDKTNIPYRDTYTAYRINLLIIIYYFSIPIIFIKVIVCMSLISSKLILFIKDYSGLGLNDDEIHVLHLVFVFVENYSKHSAISKRLV